MAKFINERDIVLVCGVSTSGKSYWNNRYIINRYNRYVLVSPVESIRGEYAGHLCGSLDELVERIDEADENGKGYRLKFTDISQFELLCSLLYLHGQEKKQKVCLIIEEAQRVIPSKKDLPDSFKDILFRGGDAHLDLIVVCQRAGSVSLDFRSQWLKIVSFRQSAPADVNWLYQSTGFDETLMLPQFKPREYLDITPSRVIHHYPEKKIDNE